MIVRTMLGAGKQTCQPRYRRSGLENHEIGLPHMVPQRPVSGAHENGRVRLSEKDNELVQKPWDVTTATILHTTIRELVLSYNIIVSVHL